MSKTEGIPGSEGEPRGSKQVKFRVKADLADAYDAVCDRDGKSRAQSLRDHVRATVEADATDDDESGRHPPDEEDLADAWLHLKKLARGRYLRKNRACAYLAVRMQDIDSAEAWRIISDLRERGYVGTSTDASLSTTFITVRE